MSRLKLIARGGQFQQRPGETGTSMARKPVQNRVRQFRTRQYPDRAPCRGRAEAFPG